MRLLMKRLAKDGGLSGGQVSNCLSDKPEAKELAVGSGKRSQVGVINPN